MTQLTTQDAYCCLLQFGMEKRIPITTCRPVRRRWWVMCRRAVPGQEVRQQLLPAGRRKARGLHEAAAVVLAVPAGR